MARQAPYVEEVDMRPVQFTPIQSLERVLAAATSQSFRDVLQAATTAKYDGWHLEMVHKELPSFDPEIDRPNPFSERADELLPWWGEMRGMEENDPGARSEI